MWASFNRHFLFLFILLGVAGGFGSQASAQDDPNGQYVTIVSATLNGETREVVAPIEPTILRLSVLWCKRRARSNGKSCRRWANRRRWDGGNVSVTEAGNKRTIAMWDPRPGRWSIQIDRKGRFHCAGAHAKRGLCLLFECGTPPCITGKNSIPQGSQLQAYAYVSGRQHRSISSTGSMNKAKSWRPSEISPERLFQSAKFLCGDRSARATGPFDGARTRTKWRSLQRVLPAIVRAANRHCQPRARNRSAQSRGDAGC